MRKRNAAVLPFALKARWIVTVESERELVKVRHRTRWYAVARRQGEEDRNYWCASRKDALGIAEMMREGFRRDEAMERDASYQFFRSWFEQQPDEAKAELRNAMRHPISD